MKDKVVVVTGGFGILGRAVGALALETGARVALIDIAAQAPDIADANAICIPGVDLQTQGAAAAALRDVHATFGRVDAIANVAGGFRWQAVADGDTETWDLLYGVNLRTALNTSRAALPYLARQEAGAIVNVGANAALKAVAGTGAYAASKSAVHRLTEALAEECKVTGIRVNAVLPSIIDTPANRADMPNADFATWVTPSSLARIILFLMSADGINGALLPVTGKV